MNMLPTAAHPTLTLGVGLSKGAARPGRERGTVSMGGGGDVGRGRGQPSGRRRRWIGDSRVIAACVGVFPVDYFLVSVNFSYFYSIFFS